ncbi:MAG: cobalamin B12-binding domain-containing protein [Candidatus Eisenbacteria bacterium]|uniref:Cobalamin B12-binding domain-containing protein n=1 Tax=Eiseniibacteriota bacterium TaxID=2212470 RepID=A0A538TKP9_UNCEI|nr:MAG: cobalamin B12-binding domain-containing protein [Candidatus Eisenbacteria bacterium]
MQRKIRVLVGKPGLDGHDRGAKVVAAALRDAGMEVIYTGLHQTPEQIVEAAIQEDVDVVALSVLSGAHMTLFPDVRRLMEERGIDDKLLTGGGIIPVEDMDTLARQGVGRLFGPGASTQDIATYIREWFAETQSTPSTGRSGGGRAPLPRLDRADATRRSPRSEAATRPTRRSPRSVAPLRSGRKRQAAAKAPRKASKRARSRASSRRRRG